MLDDLGLIGLDKLEGPDRAAEGAFRRGGAWLQRSETFLHLALLDAAMHGDQHLRGVVAKGGREGDLLFRSRPRCCHVRGAEAFEVVAVEMVDADAGGLPGLRIQIVTARPDGQIGADSVRFIFAVEGPATMPATPKPEKVL